MRQRPRNRAIKRKDKGIGLTKDQLQHLFYGHCWLDDIFPFESETDRRECWFRHKDEIFAQMHDDYENNTIFEPRLLYGERPWAWFEYENVPELRVTTSKHRLGNNPEALEIENRDIQPIPDYLTEHGLWLTDEKRKYHKMVERKEKQLKKLSSVAEVDEWREMQGTSKKAQLEYED